MKPLMTALACALCAATAYAELQNVQVGSGIRIRSHGYSNYSFFPISPERAPWMRIIPYGDVWSVAQVDKVDVGIENKYLSTIVVAVDNAVIDHLFTPLFNGEDLDGWWIRNGDETGYQVENGKLIITGEGQHDWIFTDSEYRDFVLRYEYRCVSGEGNSGVAIRAAKTDNPAFSGMEIQVIRPAWPVAWQRSCALYAAAPPSVEADKPYGEWNRVVVSCSENTVQTFLNGQELYKVRIDQITPESTAGSDWQKPTSSRVPTGHIAIQNHGDKVEFRNIAIVDWDAVKTDQ